MNRPNEIGGDRITLGSPTPARVVLHVLPWAVLFASGVLGDLARHGALSLGGQAFSLTCYLVVAYILVGQWQEVCLEPGTVHLRSWSSIVNGGPAERIVLSPKSSFYRDRLGRLFVDSHEVKLFFGLGWRPLALWFERARVPIYDDRADLEARYPGLQVVFLLLIPLLFVAALVVVWFEPLLFAGAAVSVGTLAFLYSFVFKNRRK